MITRAASVFSASGSAVASEPVRLSSVATDKKVSEFGDALG
jgi:hypothetical protein